MKKDDIDLGKIDIPKIKIDENDDKKTVIMKRCLNFTIISIIITTFLIIEDVIKLNPYVAVLYILLFIGIFIFIPFDKKRIKKIFLSILVGLLLMALVCRIFLVMRS